MFVKRRPAGVVQARMRFAALMQRPPCSGEQSILPNETGLQNSGIIVAWCTDRVVEGEGREGYSPTRPCPSGLSYFNYRINFDWDISRQGVNADRSASMTTSFSEHFYHKVRSTIDHLWMVLKIRFSIDEPADSNHAHNLTKIAIQCSLQLRKDIDGT